jgi:hypothetical protein
VRQISAGVPSPLKLGAAALAALLACRILASSASSTIDGPPKPGEDPVSPELALVDTDLRARLAAVPGPPEAPPPVAVDDPAPEVAGHRRATAPKPRRRRGHVRVGLAFAAALAACGVVAAAGFGVFVSTPPAETTGAAAPTVAIPQPSAASPGGRDFAWAPAAQAVGYDVEILRGGAVLYSKSTTAPRLHLSNRWTYAGRAITLSPGTYRWYVWPVVRTDASRARGPAIVATTFTIAGP